MTNSIILRVTARVLLPLLLLFSVFLFMRGHNEPGGGFAGGLVAASGWSLYAIAYSPAEARRALRVDPLLLIGVGLLVALSSGLLGLLEAGAFLTALWTEVYVPGLGSVALGTPVLFDLGVYLAVLGVALTIILSLAEEA
jgi:multicomponent Na+:H+ antiporter subunit B